MKSRRRFSRDTYDGIIAWQDGKCGDGCGQDLGGRVVRFDHHLGIEAGGEDTPENLRALTLECHARETKREAKARGKIRRIREQRGLMDPKKTKKQKALARMRERDL